MPDKIIHSFQQRRQLAQAFEEMAHTESEADLLEQVRALVHDYPADLLLNTLVRHLDTTSSQLRGGLGHLAALLPADETATTLRNTAANRQLSPQTRLTAALIAERFLGQPVPPALLNDLAGSNDVAFQSLLEAVEEGKRNRHVLLEYVLQMREMGQDIAFMVMDALDRLPAADRVPLLRLIVHDTRLTIAQRAVDRLIRLAESDDVTGDTFAGDSLAGEIEDAVPPDTKQGDSAQWRAARALHVLQCTLPARLAEPIARTNRKLRFAGAGYTPPAPTGWRGLLSPADMGGNQTVWCFRRPSDDVADDDAGNDAENKSENEAKHSTGALLGLVINPRLGIVQAFGSETIAPEHLPQPQAVGEMTLVKTDSGENAVLLEAPFDFCRARIVAALEANWQMEPKRDLPAEYQLYNDLIWQFALPKPDESLVRFFQTPPVKEGPEGKGPVEEEMDAGQQAAALDALDTQAAQLLQHPAMSHWRVQNRMLQQLLRRARPSQANLSPGGMSGKESDKKSGDPGETEEISSQELIRLVLRELASRPETAQISEAMITGLQAQAAWLHIAGDDQAAQQAHALAQALPNFEPQENPLLARMIAAGIGADGNADREAEN